MPDSVRHLGKKWQERCAIIMTRLRVGARSDGRTKNRNKPEVTFSLSIVILNLFQIRNGGDKSLHLRHAGFSPASREEVAGMMSHYRDETPCRGTE
ncbi:MAG: hypothetical protein E7014_01390 [Alphaproteobacteria bacterium]|nr:hypothetical protein [Alphaproteobacteria bacterium]